MRKKKLYTNFILVTDATVFCQALLLFILRSYTFRYRGLSVRVYVEDIFITPGIVEFVWGSNNRKFCVFSEYLQTEDLQELLSLNS